MTTSLLSKLDDYQKEGVDFLTSTPSAILGDDVGLGKTVQSVVAAQVAGKYPVLCIVRASLLHQWEHEIKKWSDADEVFRIDRRTTRKEMRDAIRSGTRWFLTNYASMRVREYDEKLDRNKEVPNEEIIVVNWATVIIDEAQDVKNRKNVTTRAVYRTCNKAKNIWLLTGTPVRNEPSDLWSLLHIADRKAFSSYWRWVDQFCEKWHDGYGWKVGKLRKDAEENFGKTIGPYFLRRERADYLNLPDITEQSILLKAEGRQRSTYNRMEKEMVALIGNETDPELLLADNVLAQLMRLRQLATCPETLDLPRGAKTKWLLENLPDICESHKVLLFTNFATYARELQTLLSRGRNKIKIDTFTGDLTSNERDKVLDNFKKSGQALVGTYGAMGVGLNLQEATVVILLDLPWTPDEVTQAIGRAYRRGQDNPVHVYRLLTDKTVDLDMHQTLLRKEDTITRTLAQLMLFESIKSRGN